MRFWFHYNKPESRRSGQPTMTLHYKGKCRAVRRLQCDVPVNTKARKVQPFMVMEGRANTILVRSGEAVIV